MNRRERRAAAKNPTTARNTLTAASGPDALFAAAFEHFHAGRHLDAQIYCQQALAGNAEHADALHLMGVLSFHAKQYDHSLEWLSRAIRQKPKPAYLTSLGITLLSQGMQEEALKAFDKAVQLDPGDADSWRNLGNVLVEIGRVSEAILSFEQALKLDARHWDAAYQCGHQLYRLERFHEALTYLNLCNELMPDHTSTLQLRALTLQALDLPKDAWRDFSRAHALDPTNAELCNNIGVFFRRLSRGDEALPWFDKAFELKPTFATALANKAFALLSIHKFTEALAVYDQLQIVDPGNMQAKLDRCLVHLLTGDFERGWTGREVRWQVPGLVLHHLAVDQPKWLGKEPIDGKTLLVYADEGLGDTIQFARYVPMLAARGARVILQVQDTLVSLLSGLSGVAKCVPRTAPIPTHFDFHCPITSLPAAFDTRLVTIPSASQYLAAPTLLSADWEQRLGPHDKLRVGLVWSGNPKHTNDHNRSMSLQMLSSILDVDAMFVSLQKDPRPADRATLLECREIVDLTNQLTDFVDTAALISCLDLVITVDTSVAHLAGALGRPTWIILPYVPDYRWLLDRDDSPWYPTMRLFRQSKTFGYETVLDDVRHELTAIISARNMTDQLPL